MLINLIKKKKFQKYVLLPNLEIERKKKVRLSKLYVTKNNTDP